MSSARLTVASLFCGIGGLDLGFEWGGYDVVWANDLVQAAVDSYATNFGRSAVLGDVTTLCLAEIPDVDVLIGGPPCQSFSLVGRRSPQDDRGQLVYRFLEAVRVKRPRAFVMENVPGMAASKVNGRRLTEVLAEEFGMLGYTVTTMKLDATNYLVPQRRRRIFIVGVIGAQVAVPDPLTFARECYDINASTYDVGAEAALGDLGPPVARGHLASYNDSTPSVFAQLMRRERLPNFTLHEAPQMSETDKLLLTFIPPGGNYMDVPDEHATQRILNFKKTGGRTTTYGRLHPERPSYTVNTYFRRPNVGSNFHYSEARLITAREAMRLQSLPDHFTTIHTSNDARNTLIGNAVPPLMGQAVGWAVHKALSQVGVLTTA
ncbi:DNA cytosine methyltransferase [Deinococcus sp.]|uniref:DNA cytosine methyltransferase n=1 Tax=Deinococcus sp. TaxID=47478 RepID=UPI003C7B7FA7